MNIKEILQSASKLRIAVVGDMIVDRYFDGIVERISPEAPVPILKVTSIRSNPGGAGNVAENLRGLGVNVSLFYSDKNVPSKTRVMSGQHHLVRIDEENTPVEVTYEDLDIGLDYGILNNKFNAVILSDYGKGTVSPDVATNVIQKCRAKGIPVIVDTKAQHDIFNSATIVKSNLKEWYGFTRRRRDFSGETHFVQGMQLEWLVITDGVNGMIWYDDDFNKKNIPGIKTNWSDPCGAGDTVVAILGMMMALPGYTITQACELANIGAAEVCGYTGVYALQKKDLIRRFNEVKNGMQA